MTSSTWSAVIVGGLPGRGSSDSPSSRLSMNRRRHLPTVGRVTPRSSATWVLVRPSVQASTIRERNARACEVLRRRGQQASWSRSSSVSVSGVFGRPAGSMHQFYF
jgi:hypothetical protein